MPHVHDHAEIDRAIGRGKYVAALKLLRKKLGKSPGNVRLTRKLVDVLVAIGQRERAADVLCALAEGFAQDGFTAKAIATLKKVQSIDRRRPDSEARLAALILQRNWEIAGALPGSEAARTPGRVPVRSPLFSGIHTEELVAAIGGFELETFAAGDVVFAEGDTGDCMYVLASGTTTVFARDDSGQDREIRSLRDGDFFGEIALLAGGDRTATVVATSRCEVLKFDQATVDSLSERFPQIPEIVRDFAEIRSGSPEEIEAREGGPATLEESSS